LWKRSRVPGPAALVMLVLYQERRSLALRDAQVLMLAQELVLVVVLVAVLVAVA
jgi:hypothetical protein